MKFKDLALVVLTVGTLIYTPLSLNRMSSLNKENKRLKQDSTYLRDYSDSLSLQCVYLGDDTAKLNNEVYELKEDLKAMCLLKSYMTWDIERDLDGIIKGQDKKYNQENIDVDKVIDNMIMKYNFNVWNYETRERLKAYSNKSK